MIERAETNPNYETLHSEQPDLNNRMQKYETYQSDEQNISPVQTRQIILEESKNEDGAMTGVQ